MDEAEARQRLESTIGRRRENFVLSHLSSTDKGYILKFRQGVVDIVRTRIGGAVLIDEDRLDNLLDEIRRDFRRLTARTRPTLPDR
jgi:hypothetical protein